MHPFCSASLPSLPSLPSQTGGVLADSASVPRDAAVKDKGSKDAAHATRLGAGRPPRPAPCGPRLRSAGSLNSQCRPARFVG